MESRVAGEGTSGKLSSSIGNESNRINSRLKSKVLQAVRSVEVKLYWVAVYWLASRASIGFVSASVRVDDSAQKSSRATARGKGSYVFTEFYIRCFIKYCFLWCFCCIKVLGSKWFCKPIRLIRKGSEKERCLCWLRVGPSVRLSSGLSTFLLPKVSIKYGFSINHYRVPIQSHENFTFPRQKW